MTGRAHEFYGAGDVDALFKGNPTAGPPWAQAPKSRTHRLDDPRLVHEALRNPDQHKTVSLDPRELYASQPHVIRAAAQHYMGGEYRQTGKTFADQGNVGNAQPVVFHNTDNGRLIIRSGHHRALTALLRGEQFEPLLVEGSPITHAEAAAYQHNLNQENRKRNLAAKGLSD